MEHTSLCKQDIPALEDGILLPSKKTASAAYDYIHFVTSMWLLWVLPAGSVDLDAECSVLKQLGESLAAWSGQALQAIVHSEVSLHDWPPRPLLPNQAVAATPFGFQTPMTMPISTDPTSG
jgi:hypothetical protein